jgi:hypothetical protein
LYVFASLHVVNEKDKFLITLAENKKLFTIFGELCNRDKGFAIAGVPSFADTFVQGGSSVLRMKFSAKTTRYRKPPKRYNQWLKTGSISNQRTAEHRNFSA